MKKLLVFHHYNSSLGAGLSLLHILQSLDREQFDIHVCLPAVSGDLDKKIIEMGIRVIYAKAVCAYMHFNGSPMPCMSLQHLRNIQAIRTNKAEISDIILQEKPDIVAVNSMTLFWIGTIAKKHHVRSICFHRETYKHGLLGVRSAYMKKRLSTDFDIVVFLSNFDIEQTPKGTAKFVRITDKVDVQAYEVLKHDICRKQLNLPDGDTPLILYAGGMAKLKGPEVLVQALEKMKHTEAKLVFLQYQPQSLNGMKAKVKNAIKVLMGKNLQYRIESYIDRHDLGERIIFRPATDCVEKYFVACDAVVFPCRDAHQARPLYEAGIAGKPVVITDFPNYHEFVDESNGWLFPKGDANALAHCLDEAIENSDSQRVVRNRQRTMRDNNLANMEEELKQMLTLLEEK